MYTIKAMKSQLALDFSCALLFQSGRNKLLHFGHTGLGTENLPGLVRVLG